MADLGSIRTILKTYDQEHLLAWFEELDSSQQSILLAQLDALDFPQIQSWIEQYVLQKPTLEIPTNIQPPQIIPFGGGDNAEAARAQGQELLRAGKVAAFVVAGGQGTRLGFEGPKGCYPATPVTEASDTASRISPTTTSTRQHRTLTPNSRQCSRPSGSRLVRATPRCRSTMRPS